MLQLQRSWVRSQHPSAQWNLRAADEAVLNIVRKKKKKSPKKWIQTVILSLVDCDRLYCVLFTARVCFCTFRRWQPIGDSITGWLKLVFVQTNEHQRHLNKKLISELHVEVETIQTSWKILFFRPSRNGISSLPLGSGLSWGVTTKREISNARR